MKRITTVLVAAALIASTSAYAALHGETANEARSAAVPSWMMGFWDDTSYKKLTMEILRPGHAFCTRLVKTRSACARTPLAGHVIGAALVLRGDRLTIPERYRSHNVGTCAEYVPIYRISEDGSPMRLTLIGYRDPRGRPVRIAAVRAADCEPPNRWQKRSGLPSLSWELQAAQAATAPFRSVAAARKAGYVPASPCIASPSGAEGIHYVNPKLLDDPAVNPTQPELLLYEPLRTGGLRLVGVEYFMVDADGKLETAADRPTLFGRPFQGPMPGHGPGEPVHYDLHVALWKSNPRGMFVGFNPTVSCRHDANRLYGKYQVRLGPNVDPQVPAGTWTLTMSRGKYSLIVSSEPIDNHGALRVVGETVVFSKEVLCPGAVGRYRWNLQGRKLRLTLIGNDKCSGDDRVTVMTTKLWTKVG
jgi:hypothetical protein